MAINSTRRLPRMSSTSSLPRISINLREKTSESDFESISLKESSTHRHKKHNRLLFQGTDHNLSALVERPKKILPILSRVKSSDIRNKEIGYEFSFGNIKSGDFQNQIRGEQGDQFDVNSNDSSNVRAFASHKLTFFQTIAHKLSAVIEMLKKLLARVKSSYIRHRHKEKPGSEFSFGNIKSGSFQNQVKRDQGDQFGVDLNDSNGFTTSGITTSVTTTSVTTTSVTTTSVTTTSGVTTRAARTRAARTRAARTRAAKTSGVTTSGVTTSGVTTSGVTNSSITTSFLTRIGVTRSGVRLILAHNQASIPEEQLVVESTAFLDLIILELQRQIVLLKSSNIIDFQLIIYQTSYYISGHRTSSSRVSPSDQYGVASNQLSSSSGSSMGSILPAIYRQIQTRGIPSTNITIRVTFSRTNVSLSNSLFYQKRIIFSDLLLKSSMEPHGLNIQESDRLTNLTFRLFQSDQLAPSNFSLITPDHLRNLHFRNHLSLLIDISNLKGFLGITAPAA